MPRTTNETRRVSEERITKRVVIKTDSTHLVRKKRSINQGAAEYKWSCELVGVETTGKDSSLDYIDRVEFLLHETFKNPLHVVTHPPFKIHEEGWGAFDMKIRVFFVGADENTPYEIQHDLNFVKEHYEVRHNIIIRNPSPELYRALLPSRVVDAVTVMARRHQEGRNSAAPSSVDGDTPPRTRPISTPETSVSRKRSRSREQSDTPEQGSKLKLDPRETRERNETLKNPAPRHLQRELASSPLSPSINTLPLKKIDIELMVEHLMDLEDDDIRDVVIIVENHRTEETFVEYIDENYEFDLYTLPREAVIEIYQFLYEDEDSPRNYRYCWSEREDDDESDAGTIGANEPELEEPRKNEDDDESDAGNVGTNEPELEEPRKNEDDEESDAGTIGMNEPEWEEPRMNEGDDESDAGTIGSNEPELEEARKNEDSDEMNEVDYGDDEILDDIRSQSPESPKGSSEDEIQPMEESGMETEPIDSQDDDGTDMDNVQDTENDEQPIQDDHSQLEDEIEKILQDDESEESENENTERLQSEDDGEERVEDGRLDTPMHTDETELKCDNNNNNNINGINESEESQEMEDGELVSEPEDGEIQ